MSRRPVAAAAVLYLVLSVVMFAPGLAPGRTLSASDLLWTATPWDASRPHDVPGLGSNYELADSAFQFQPALRLTRATLPSVPLWDPSLLGGRPYMADPQAGVFSPFSVPAYVLPFWKSLAVMAILKLFVAAFGAFLLARVLGMRHLAALLTGLVFGFSLWCVSWVSWTTMSVWTWLPWLCLLCELCVRAPGPLPVAGLAAVVGAQWLGGHPSSSFQILVVVLVAWAVRAAVPWPGRPAVARRLAALAIPVALGTALAAVMLLPFGELLSNSDDLAVRKGLTAFFHQPGRYLLGMFLHDWWGHGRSGLVVAGELPERAYYVGALPLMLAVAALVRARDRVRVAFAAVGAVCLAIALGAPPLYGLVTHLPGFSAAQNGRLAVIAVLALAVLAGFGAHDLLAGRVPRRQRVLTLAGALAVAAIPALIAARSVEWHALGSGLRVAFGVTSAMHAAPHAAGGLRGVVRMASLIQWLVFAGLAVVLLAVRLRRRALVGAGVFAALALVLVAADLFVAGMGYNPAIPVRNADPPATPAIRYLQRQAPARFAGLQPTAPVSLMMPLPPNQAMTYRVLDARGYVLPSPGRTFDLWRHYIAPNPHCYYFFCTLFPGTSPRSLRALGLLGVSLLLQNRRDQPLHGPAWRLAYRGGDGRIYRNPEALPRVFLVDRQQVVAGSGRAAATVTSPAFPARTVAVTERPIPGLAAAGGAAAGSPGAARIESYGADRVVVGTQARRRSLLVLTDAWYPGWTARVDGHGTGVHRVDYLIRGIVVPPGRHRVELRYQPASWTAGWILSVLAALALTATVLAGWRRRLRPGAV